jgi:iron complex transport system substrate-binding protein
LRRLVPAFLFLAAWGCARETHVPPIAAAPQRSVNDDLGRPVPLPLHVQRVVTLSPNVTEMIFAIGAGAKIVASDDFSNFPSQAAQLPRVGGLQPNIEKIVQVRPDVVIASTEGNHPNLAKALAAAHIPVYVVRSDRIAQIGPAMRKLGAMLEAPETEQAIGALESAIAAQKRARPQPRRILFAVWTDPLYVAGRQTFVDDLYELTGAKNAVPLDGWPQYSLESFAKDPPDILLYPKGAVTEQQVKAMMVRAHRVVPYRAVDEDIFQRPGPRVEEAAARLNAILDEVGLMSVTSHSAPKPRPLRNEQPRRVALK